MSIEPTKHAYFHPLGHVVIRVRGHECNMVPEFAEEVLADLTAAVAKAKEKTPREKYFAGWPVNGDCYYGPRFKACVPKEWAHELFDAGFEAGKAAR